MMTKMIPDKDEIKAQYTMDQSNVSITPQERRAAVLMTAGYSQNAEDCKLLLEHLGLDPRDRILP